MVQTKTVKLSKLLQDSQNANEGNPRGLRMIETSLKSDGFGRSLLVDKNGRLIAGNKTALSIQKAMGDKDVILIETDGSEIIAVQRTDADLEDPDPNNTGRRLAYADNISHEFSFKLNLDQVVEDIGKGFDFESLNVSLEDLGKMLDRDINSILGQDNVDLEGFGQVNDIDVKYRVVVDNLSYEEAHDLSETIPDSKVEQYRDT